MISQRLRSQGILGVAPYLHAGYQCCAACAFAHLYTSFLNWRRGEACAKDKSLYPVWGDHIIWKMPGQLFAFPSPGLSSSGDVAPRHPHPREKKCGGARPARSTTFFLSGVGVGQPEMGLLSELESPDSHLGCGQLAHQGSRPPRSSAIVQGVVRVNVVLPP